MKDLDLRLLRYFAAIAEEDHVGRAAARLFVSQPALSKQIRRFEQVLGVSLMVRRGRGIELTAAGRALAERAPALLRHAQEVLDATARAADGLSGHVRVAYLPGASHLASELLRSLGDRSPGVEVALRRVDWSTPTACLHDDQADLCFLRPPVDETGLEMRVVSTEPRVAALRHDHPLAGRTTLGIGELRDEPVIDTTFQRSYWAVDPRPDGSVPRRGPVADTVEDMLAVVGAGRAMAITPASIAAMFPGVDVVFVPVDDIAPTEIAVAWRPHSLTPAARRVLEVALEPGSPPGL